VVALGDIWWRRRFGGRSLLALARRLGFEVKTNQQQHNKALHPTAYSPAFRSQARFTSGFRRRVSLVVVLQRAASTKARRFLGCSRLELPRFLFFSRSLMLFFGLVSAQHFGFGAAFGFSAGAAWSLW